MLAFLGNIFIFIGLSSTRAHAATKDIDPTKNYYAILKVKKTATTMEIEASWRRLRSQYHPDKNPNNPAIAEKFKAAKHAYEILSDSGLRATYDQLRGNNWRPPSRAKAYTAEAYLREWHLAKAANEKAGMVNAAAITLDSIITSIRLNESYRLSNLTLKYSFSGQLNTFILNAWEETYSSEIILKKIFSDSKEVYHRLYINLCLLRRLQRQNGLHPLDTVNRAILWVVFGLSISSEEMTSAFAYSESEDFTTADFRDWLEKKSHADQLRFAHLTWDWLNKDVHPLIPKNLAVLSFLDAEYFSFFGRIKSFARECSELLKAI